MAVDGRVTDIGNGAGRRLRASAFACGCPWAAAVWGVRSGRLGHRMPTRQRHGAWTWQLQTGSYDSSVASNNGFSDYGVGRLARVRRVADNGYRMYIELPNGQTGWVDFRQPVDVDPGAIVLIGEDRFEVVPAELWEEEPRVAVVRIKNPDKTVVDSGGQPWIVPTRHDIDYHQGNTVEATTAGVRRVLADKPIRYFDLPEVDDSMIEQYIVKPDDIPESFDDFGGLSDVVARAKKLIEIRLTYRDALKSIGARMVKGVLFTGGPGTGKTMLARIIAKESRATFYEISGPEIVSRWYGQSEEILRRLFNHAKDQESAIVFFDEIDSVAAHRDNDSHEASRRVVAQLLTLMDGFSSNNVVVIATTNKPENIDVALRRPGRFDWEIEFPPPGRDDRELILRARAGRLRTVGQLPHDEVADWTASWSPADLAAIWTEAALLAASDGRRAIALEDYVGGFECVASQRARASNVGARPKVKNDA